MTLTQTDLDLLRADAWSAKYDDQVILLALIEGYEEAQAQNEKHLARLDTINTAYESLSDVFDKGTTLTAARVVVGSVRADLKAAAEGDE